MSEEKITPSSTPDVEVVEPKISKKREAKLKVLAKDESDTVETSVDKVDFTKGGVENFKFYPDNPENHRHKYRWTMKEPSKFYDPCEESRQASMNCLLRNQTDRLACQDFFDAYKECRKDFFNKKRQDKIDGKGGWGFW
ncbi:hypothetical protein DFJ63DRAFT_334701 [Scheffersomyces coipomensis]|uniref:uncharacterized protein n=1 Tax=Scheffersomyces coipomensis TaxID=1788519 RepID=UPI00315D83D5